MNLDPLLDPALGQAELSRRGILRAGGITQWAAQGGEVQMATRGAAGGGSRDWG